MHAKEIEAVCYHLYKNNRNLNGQMEGLSDKDMIIQLLSYQEKYASKDII
jgi:hypothetical protein